MGATRTYALISIARRIHTVSNSIILIDQNYSLGKHELEQFKDDKSILMHLTKVLLKTPDPEELICSETKSINSDNIEDMDGKALKDVFDDVY